MKEIIDFTDLGEDNFNNFVNEHTDQLLKLLTPIIQQWVLTDMRWQSRPPCISSEAERFSEYEKTRKDEVIDLRKYYISMIHALLGYTES